MLNKLKAMLDRHHFYNLCVDKDRWRGMFTCKRNPKLERIYRFLPDGSRICIHKTYDPDLTGEDSKLHIHAWPIAVKILSGSYAMDIGRTENPDDDTPVKIMTTVMTKGSMYELPDPMTWHRVVPITKEVTSIMLNGPVWEPMPKFLMGEKEHIRVMSKEEVSQRLDDFTMDLMLEKIRL